MARRRRRRKQALPDRLEATAQRAAKALDRVERDPPRRRDRADGSSLDVIPGYRRAREAQIRREAPLRPRRERRTVAQEPRQARLFKQREALKQALAVETGRRRLGGRAAQRELRMQLPEEIRRIICGDRKKRRQSLFAKRLTVRGSAAKQREFTWRSEVKC